MLGGKKNAPRPAPEVTRNERSEETGLASPWVNWLADGDRPSATTAWITQAVESGSVEPGVLAVLG